MGERLAGQFDYRVTINIKVVWERIRRRVDFRISDAFLTLFSRSPGFASPVPFSRRAGDDGYRNRVKLKFLPGGGRRKNASGDLVADAGLAQALDIVVAVRLLFERVDSGDLVDAEIGIQPR